MSSIMATTIVSYEPLPGQESRCSHNISGWDVPSGAEITFDVTVPPGYPQPTFQVEHDKTGHKDTCWYKNISNGVSVNVDSGDGESGKHNIYIITTSELPEGKPNANYSVTIWIS